jgi:cysteinyl-tRNA synthetase
MPLQVYNTLTRKKEPFPKSPPAEISMYVCGPTVYKPSHIGHMVGPVIFDAVKRYLRYLGFRVKWVVNITDVDDKLIRRAGELNTTVKELAERMTANYIDCLRKLNVQTGPEGIDLMPRATEHIAGMIRMIGTLIEKDFAYPAGGDVYFDITKDVDYGKLCGFDPEQLEAGSRIELSDRKRNPGDFALWKGAKPGEPQWESPWGAGRPGWHIECSVMSSEILGETIDIHGGGLDLRFPHHEDELAQSESATGKPFARIWMHNGLLKMGNAKMAGSVGNVINVADALQHMPGEALRFFLISTHYRSPIDLGEYKPEEHPLPQGMQNAHRALEGFHRFFERYQRITGESFYHLPNTWMVPASTGWNVDIVNLAGPLAESVPGLRRRFLECMDDDFNTGGAVGALFELLTTLNRFADASKLEAVRPGPAADQFRTGVMVLRELSMILGLFWEPPPAPAGENEAVAAGLNQLLGDLGHPPAEPAVATMMQSLIGLRQEARKTKNFAIADQIRKRLAEIGVTLEDRPGGTGWRIGGA